MDAFSTWHTFDITPEEKTRRPEETVRLRCTDDVVVEADKEAMVRYSGLIKSETELFGIDVIINVPIPSPLVKAIVRWCESENKFTEQTKLSGLRAPMSRLRAPIFDVPDRAPMPSFDVGRVELSDPIKSNDQEASDLEDFHRGIFQANFFNKFCKLECNWETITRLHEAADFMQIPSLLHFTSILIREAPSRAFLGVVSPCVDYDSLEAYRYRAEVAAV